MNELIVSQNQNFNMSSKYKTITTKTVLQTLTAEGYEVNSFSSAKVRKASKDGFQKHLLRISRPDLKIDIGGLRPEIIIINSYDGSSSFKVLVGLFRFACANGLIVGSSYFERTIRHVGEAMPKVLVALDEVQLALPKVAADIERFSKIQLTQGKKMSFAETIAAGVAPQEFKPVNVENLLEVRRKEDEGDDLFTVLNVIQENVLKGNLNLETVKENMRVVRKMRTIKSLTRSTEVNQLVWDTASSLAA